MPSIRDKAPGWAVIAALSLSIAHAWAQAPASTAGLPARTVGELLEIESKMAAERAQEKLADFQSRQRGKAAQSAATAPAGGAAPLVATAKPAAPPEDRIEVLAVLGIDGAKVANVRINGELRVRQPVGATFGGYSIEQIGSSCVVLRPVAVVANPPTAPRSAARATNKGTAPAPVLRRVCFSEYDAAPAVMAGIPGAAPGMVPVITAPVLPMPMASPISPR